MAHSYNRHCQLIGQAGNCMRIARPNDASSGKFSMVIRLPCTHGLAGTLLAHTSSKVTCHTKDSCLSMFLFVSDFQYLCSHWHAPNMTRHCPLVNAKKLVSICIDRGRAICNNRCLNNRLLLITIFTLLYSMYIHFNNKRSCHVFHISSIVHSAMFNW